MPPKPIELLTYTTGGRAEQVVGFGAGSPSLLIVPPLFDEMNRVRRTLLQTMRLLAARGLATRLIDLPGCNESLAPFDTQTLHSWRSAVADAVSQFGATHLLSIRGGALIDDAVNLPTFRVAPVAGAPIVRALLRVRIAAEREAGRTVTQEELLAGSAGAIELAGYSVGSELLQELQAATPVERDGIRTLHVGVGGLAGSAIWLRTEPGDDAELAASLADALCEWTASCAAI